MRYGAFNETIHQFYTVDGGISFDAATYLPGLRLDLFGQNLFFIQNNSSPDGLNEIPGFYGLGRLVQARLIYTF